MFKYNGFTQKANEAINLAIAQASALGHTYIGSEHLLYGLVLIEGSAACVALTSRGITSQDLAEIIVRSCGKLPQSMLSAEDITPCCKRILDLSVLLAHEYRSKTVGTEHLLLALLREEQSAACFMLKELGVDCRVLQKAMADVAESIGSVSERGKTPPIRAQKASVKTQMLDRYSRDLTELARERRLDPVIGRDAEIDRVIRILCRRQKNNPCLIGEAGVGKTAVIEGLSQRIAKGEVPDELEGKRLVSLDLTSVLAGTKYRGDFEERIKSIISEVSAAGSIILFIDEIHNIMGVGAAEGAIDAANILKPQLARGELQVIGATTFEEYRRHIEKDSALERRFQSVEVKEPTQEQAIEILRGLRERYELHHRIKISDEALSSAVRLSAKYIPERFLPDKAIDLIDEAAAGIKLKNVISQDSCGGVLGLKSRCEAALASCDFETVAKLREQQRAIDRISLERAEKNGSLPVLNAEDVAILVSQSTGIEVSSLTGEETKRLAALEEKIGEMLIGQKEAVSAVSRAIRRGRVGLGDPNRPIGSFLFLGPSGVGKTQLCRSLAKVLFGSEEATIRLDMSEYMEKQAVSRLIGSPPGYVGYDDGGQLTEKIRRRPYSVVLLDEIEKAHPEVLHILLQLLEEGRLTDSKGKLCSFKNAIIVMTSNVGAKKLSEKKHLGFSTGATAADEKTVKQDILTELKRLFRPEFLNRIDEIVVFMQLGREELYKIAEGLLERVAQRLLDKGVSIEFSGDAIEKLISIENSAEYGARPLKRRIQTDVEDLLAQRLLSGEISRGDSVFCTVRGEKLDILKTALNAPAG